MSIESTRNDEIVKRYINKAAGGKYLKIIQDKLGNITIEHLIVLLEACKVVPFSIKPDPEYEKKVKEWMEQYRDSAPTRALGEKRALVQSILKQYGWKDTDTASWGAFIQVMEPRLKPLKENLKFVKTDAQSANYSRAMFMIMDIQEALDYAKKRAILCMAVCLAAYKVLGNDVVNKVLKEEDRTKKLTTLLRGKKEQLCNKTHVDNVSKDLLLKDVNDIDTGKPESLAIAVAGALMVEYRMMFQTKEARGANKKSLNAENLGEISKQAKYVHSFFVDRGYLKEIPTTTVIDVANKQDANMQAIFDAYKAARAIVRALRRAVNSDDAGGDTGAKRDYSKWQLIW